MDYQFSSQSKASAYVRRQDGNAKYKIAGVNGEQTNADNFHTAISGLLHVVGKDSDVEAGLWRSVSQEVEVVPKNIIAITWWMKPDGTEAIGGMMSRLYMSAFDEGQSRYLGIYYDDGEERVREPTFLFPQGTLVIPKGGSYELPSEAIIAEYQQPGGRKCWLYKIKITGGNRTYSTKGTKSVTTSRILIPAVPGYVEKGDAFSSYLYEQDDEYEYAIQDGTILIPPTN